MFNKIKKINYIESIKNLKNLPETETRIPKDMPDEFIKKVENFLPNEEINNEVVNLLSNHNFKIFVNDFINNGFSTNSLGAIRLFTTKNKQPKIIVAYQDLDTLEMMQYEYSIKDFINILSQVKNINIKKNPEKTAIFNDGFDNVIKFLNNK